MKICSFTVPGRAIPAVRMNYRGRKTKASVRYMHYRNQVSWIARSEYRGAPVKCDVGVNINIYLSGGVQGDVDNYFKSITDSMNKLIYNDDRQIKEMSARKIECIKDEERVEVIVYEL